MAALKKKSVSFQHEDKRLSLLLNSKDYFFDNYLQTVLNSTREAILLLDTKGNIKLFNKYAQKLILEFTGSDIYVVSNLIEAVPDWRKKDVLQNIEGSAAGQVKEYEVKYHGDNWLQVSFFPIYNDKNIIDEICGTLKDITARKKVEERVKKSEEMYRSLVESIMEGVVFQSVDKKNNTANDAAAIILGVQKELVIEHGLQVPGFEWINQQGEPVYLEKIFCPRLNENKSARNVVLGLRKNASVTWLSLNAEPVKKDNAGNVQGCVFTFTDITEAIKNREELNLLSKVVKETSNMVVITDKEEKIVWANDSFTKTSGYSLIEAMNKKPGQLLDGPEKDIIEVKKIKNALDKGEPIEGEILNYSKTGKKYWAHYNIHPVRDEEGRLTKFFSIQSDITELKRIQEEIVRQRFEHQSQVAYATIKGQEEKQNQIGQELHDNVNQILAASKIYLGFVLNGKGNLQENVSFVYNNIQLAIDEIRELSHQLVAPRFNDKNLAEALEELIKNLHSTCSTHFSFHQQCEAKMNPDIKLALYRIAQEQLNNITRHANASNVHFSVKDNEENIIMLIKDDGKGFNIKEKKPGIGISNIYNRAESLNGKAEIISTPGNGCELCVIIPTQNFRQMNY